MQDLFGNYKITLDEKSRIRIPTKLRPFLGEKFFIINGNSDCLFVLAKEDYSQLINKFKSIPLSDLEAQDDMRFIFASSFSPEEDSQNRFILPSSAREYASISKNIVFLGANDRIEIWSEEIYNERFIKRTKDRNPFGGLKNYGV